MTQKATYEELEKRIADLEKQVNQYHSSAVKYQVLFNSFPHGITVSDANGNILETNAAAEKLLGVKKSEHEKRHIEGKEWRIIRTDGSDMPIKEWASVIALKENRMVFNCEMGIVRSVDDIKWINVTAAPLLLDGQGVVVTYNDITEKKYVEKELQENENRFRQFFENTGFYGYIISPDGLICEVNNSALEALGYSKHELIGAPLLKIYADESIENAKKLFVEWKLTGHIHDAEMVVKTKNGDKRWVILNVDSVRDNQGFILHSTSIQVDITDRKFVEQALKNSEEKFRSIFDNISDAIYIHKIWDCKFFRDEAIFAFHKVFTMP